MSLYVRCFDRMETYDLNSQYCIKFQENKQIRIYDNETLVSYHNEGIIDEHSWQSILRLVSIKKQSIDDVSDKIQIEMLEKLDHKYIEFRYDDIVSPLNYTIWLIMNPVNELELWKLKIEREILELKSYVNSLTVQSTTTEIGIQTKSCEPEQNILKTIKDYSDLYYNRFIEYITSDLESVIPNNNIVSSIHEICNACNLKEMIVDVSENYQTTVRNIKYENVYVYCPQKKQGYCNSYTIDRLIELDKKKLTYNNHGVCFDIGNHGIKRKLFVDVLETILKYDTFVWKMVEYGNDYDGHINKIKIHTLTTNGIIFNIELYYCRKNNRVFTKDIKVLNFETNPETILTFVDSPKVQQFCNGRNNGGNPEWKAEGFFLINKLYELLVKNKINVKL